MEGSQARADTSDTALINTADSGRRGSGKLQGRDHLCHNNPQQLSGTHTKVCSKTLTMHPSSEKLTFGTSAVFGRSLSGFLIQFLHQHPFSKINMTQTLTLCSGDTTPALSWTSPPSWWPGLCPSRGWRSASPASPSRCRRGWSTGPSPGTSGTSGCTAAPAPGPGVASPLSTRTPPTARACGSWTRALSPASSKSVSKASCCVFSQFSLPSNVEQRVDSSSLFTIKHSQRSSAKSTWTHKSTF